MATASFPRHKRNNSTGSVSTAGMCSFGSFDFVAGQGQASDNFSVDGDSIVSEFERMCGKKSSSNIGGNFNGSVASGNNNRTNAAAASPLVFPSPNSDCAAQGPMRRRLGAVDCVLAADSPEVRALNLPFTPGHSGGAAGGPRNNRYYTTSSPSHIGEIIVGAAQSPAPSLGGSTLGGGSTATNGTPVSQTTMKDLLDALNSLEDDGSSFGGSIGQSTISSATNSHSSSRPPRALNIPAKRLNLQGAGPNGIPRPFSAARNVGTSSINNRPMPPMPPTQKRDVPPRNPRSTTTTNKTATTATIATGKGSQLQIPTFDDEVQAEHKNMMQEEKSQPQSVVAPDKENAAPKLPPMHRGNRNRINKPATTTGAAFVNNKPLKQNNRQKAIGGISNGGGNSGAFPTFNTAKHGDENMAPTNNGKKQGNTTTRSMKPLVKSHSRVKSTKIYTRTLPSIQQKNGGDVSFSAFGERNTNVNRTRAEF